MVKLKILFAHGWGFDNRLWDGLIEYLPKNIEPLSLSFGYTGNDATTAFNSDDDIVCVGHSLGALWLLKHVPAPKAFIAINGFDCFHRYVPQPAMQQMVQNLNRNAEAQMRGFYEACGAPYQNCNWQKDALMQGLEQLMTWDATEIQQALTCPVALLSSEDDVIVPPEMSQKAWRAEHIVWSENGGHVLPLLRPEWCAHQIIGVTREL